MKSLGEATFIPSAKDLEFVFLRERTLFRRLLGIGPKLKAEASAVKVNELLLNRADTSRLTLLLVPLNQLAEVLVGPVRNRGTLNGFDVLERYRHDGSVEDVRYRVLGEGSVHGGDWLVPTQCTGVSKKSRTFCGKFPVFQNLFQVFVEQQARYHNNTHPHCGYRPTKNLNFLLVGMNPVASRLGISP